VVFARCVNAERLRRFGGNFSGHYSVARGQKAWFLPVASMQGACGALAAISADITP
jgi:hypothetical protein